MYARKVFQKKTIKRHIEKMNVDAAITQFNGTYNKGKGNVISLCGPCAKEHYHTLLPFVQDTPHTITFVERIPKIVHNIRRETEDLPNSCTCLGDVWDILFSSKKKFKYIDLDFCATDKTLTDQQVFNKIKKLAASNIPIKTGFSLTFTVCQRKRKMLRDEIRTMIENIFIDNDWIITRSQYTSYKDGTKGAPMLTYLFCMKKIPMGKNNI